MDNLLSTNFAMAAACSLFLAPSVMLYNSTLAQRSDDPPCVIIWPGWTLTVTYSDEIPLTECQYDGQGYSEQQLMGSSQKPGWWRHPKIKENYKTVCGAILLTVVGAALFLVGIGIVASPDRGLHCLVFFIGGVLCLIPGVYHVVYIILAINGVGGYNLYNLPVFNT